MRFAQLRIAEAFAVSKDAGVKSLKGSDRATLKKLQSMVEDAIAVSMFACLRYECCPFIESLGVSVARASEKTVVSTQMLTAESPILPLRGAGVRHGKLVESLINHCAAVSPLLEGINNGLKGTLSVQDSQKCLEAWYAWCKQMKEISADVCKAACSNEKHKNESTGVPTAITETSKTLELFLGGKVISEAVEVSAVCVKFAIDKLLCQQPAPLGQEDLSGFQNSWEASTRLSSVMGEKGAVIRQGLQVIYIMVESYKCFQAEEAKQREDADEEESAAAIAARAKAVGIVKKGYEDIGGEDGLNQRLQALLGLVSGHATQKDFLPGEERTKFLEDCKAYCKTSLGSVNAYVGELQVEFKEAADTIWGSFPDLTLPQQCTFCEDLENLVTVCLGDVHSLITDAGLKNAVVETSASLEELKQRVEEAARGLGVVDTTLFPEIVSVRQQCKDCLTWLPPGSHRLWTVDSRL